ncbi:MAG: hypothetical protein GVY16_06995 [Planctomycetes bacterium]|jgi:hypothetical protein|nr:hypothetical protein [Planctomycetota bacterium]
MSTLGMELLEASLRIATVVVPVALYFLLLGLLNTRRCPQLLTGRQDVALLSVALSPLALQPAVHFLDGGAPAVMAAAGAIVLGVWLLAPRGHQWVIYNLPLKQARTLIDQTLADIGIDADIGSRCIRIDEDTWVELSSFPALRNVSLRCHGGDDTTWQAFANALGDHVDRIDVEPSPTAVALLLVATGMLVAPMAMVAHQAPEIVRMLADLLP